MDEVSAKLAAIFHNVNEWLKFAEAKNAVLLAFSGAGVTATLTLLATAQNLPNSLRVGLLVTTFLLCSCALVCSLSFLPKTNLEALLWRKNKPSQKLKSDKDNFYYFGDLRKYNHPELLDKLNKFYFENKMNSPYKKEYEDLAAQITINAEIASQKYQIFTYGLYLLISAILAVPISMLFSLIIFRNL